MLGPPQVAFAALSLGRLGPRNGGASPSLVSSKLLLIFHFLGEGVSFAFRGDRAWRPPHHALGQPTSSPPTPPRQLRGPSFSGGRRWVSEGQLAQLGPARRGWSRNPWARAAWTPFLGPSCSPQGQALEETFTPRAMFRERAVLWMACAF